LKRFKKERENKEVAGNYTHLGSASCVKHFREIKLQPSRLGMGPDPGKGNDLLPLSQS
jgi:hypothetical protein